MHLLRRLQSRTFSNYTTQVSQGVSTDIWKGCVFHPGYWHSDGRASPRSGSLSRLLLCLPFTVPGILSSLLLLPWTGAQADSRTQRGPGGARRKSWMRYMWLEKHQGRWRYWDGRVVEPGPRCWWWGCKGRTCYWPTSLGYGGKAESTEVHTSLEETELKHRVKLWSFSGGWKRRKKPRH